MQLPTDGAPRCPDVGSPADGRGVQPRAGVAARRGYGQVIDIPYRDSYRVRFPDCWPYDEAGHPGVRSLLVVKIDNTPARMTQEEFLARKRAKNRALAEVWVVGKCSTRLPAFDTDSIEPLSLRDLR